LNRLNQSGNRRNPVHAALERRVRPALKWPANLPPALQIGDSLG